MTNSEKRKNRIGFYLPLFVIVTPIAVILRTLAYLNDMNLQGHFESNSMVFASNIIVGIFAFIFLLHSLSHSRNDSVPIESFSNYPSFLPSGILAVATLFSVYELFSSITPVFKTMVENEDEFTLSPQTIIAIAGIIFGLGATASFVVNILIETKHSQLRALFGIFTVLFLCFYSISIYFGGSGAANVQQRALTVISVIFSASFFLFEIRMSLGRSKWHSYVGFGLSSSTILFYSSVPAIIYYFAKQIVPTGSTVIQLVLMLSLAIYTTARTILIACAPEDEICEMVDEILDMDYERTNKSTSHARNNILKEENDGETNA